MSTRKNDFLKPVNLSDLLWCYADDKELQIIARWPSNTQTFRLTWKRLDRLRKQAAEARTQGAEAMSAPAEQARAELERLADRLKAWLHETSPETCYDLIAASEAALRAVLAPPASPAAKVYDALSEVDHECT